MDRESGSTWRFVYRGPEGTDIVVIETNDKSLFDGLLRMTVKRILADGMIFRPNKEDDEE